MIPSILDRQIRQGVADFVRTTFSITTPCMSKMVDNLCDDPDRMFKGPYISLGLPFENGKQAAEVYFPELKVPFLPFRHQELAWERLNKYQSTLVATGTGSGKTECFLFPVFNHVRLQKERGWSGVKAILVYPMNALATDQARRIAKAIEADPALKGKITAGLYVGGKQEKPDKVMGPENVITDRNTIRLSPPDILLTNYKMLDYLLTRPKDKPIWEANRPGGENEPATLRFLVVDELHTFDGAQGTDLAMLIRRLKHRLGCRPGELCCVGTSATLGGPDSVSQMINYAQQIFGETFLTESLITEQRQSPKTFLSDVQMDMKGSGFPEWSTRNLLQPGNYQTPEEYLGAQVRIWFPGEASDLYSDRVMLGQKLKGHVVFRIIIDIVAATPRTEKEVLSELSRHFKELDPKSLARENSGTDVKEIDEFLSLCFSSFIALVAHARSIHPSKNDDFLPFIQQVRVQSWTRELRRMVATVSPVPRLDFADDISQEETGVLPVVYCRECGNAGWVGLVPNQNADKLRKDDKVLSDFYKTFFQQKPSQYIRFLFPDLKGRAVLKQGRTSVDVKLCTRCLKMLAPSVDSCSCGGKEFVEVLVPDSQYQDSKGHWFTRKHCPGCGTRQSLVVLGAQSASLSSALINQLFASPYNTDKKLIAFSDNVQDAAHRASFFGARTWKFNFRAAIQQYLQMQKGPQPLLGLGERVLDFWRGSFKNELDTVAMFLPADLEWLTEVVESQAGKRTQFSPEFWRAIKGRLDWEVFTEYGLDCRKGRTLEKSGCSTVHVVYKEMQSDYEELSIRMQNLDPSLQGKINPAEIRQLIHGIIRRWLHNGAIEHPALDSYINSLGVPFLINKNSYWMKGFGQHSRTPAFAWRQIPGKDREERLDPVQTKPDKPTSWYAHWLLKYFGQACPMFLSFFEEAMTLVLGYMEKTGIAVRKEIEGTYLWTLNPGTIEVDCDVRHFRCHICGHQVSVPLVEAPVFQGLYCLKASCNGTYVLFEQTGRYYGDLYKNGNLARLMPSEHTALLNRDEREIIEKEFKAKPGDRTPWAPNLLSCTPTLELGIDIGDLSSVLLCSVPPEQAAFLQRIGRAGRTDGNAVVSTIAEGQPHDLYFWTDPREMLNGNIEPPGVFLDATAVLERQLMAFCLDRWVYLDPSATIPKQVSVMIANWKTKKQNAFPLSFVAFVKDNAASIVKDFIGLLENNASPATLDYLIQFLDSSDKAGSFSFKFNECLALSERMRNSLTSRRKLLEGDIAKKKADPAANQELIEELQMERDALSDLVRKIDERKCFQFLTDEGLIPNYAFPEAGIQLKSIVYRRDRGPAGGAGSKSFKTTYEYERAAAAAISDFAPGNYFYAHRRRVQIDQVDHNLSPPELFRICPECGYMENEVEGATPAECPHCQCDQFGSRAQVQRLMRIRQVYATSGDRRSRVGDDSDSRDVRFFERSMLVGLRGSDLLGAWQLDNVVFPFGYEVRRKVLLRELNFGPFSSQCSALRIAGKDIAAEGFEICTSCGKVSLNNKDIVHTYHCAQQHPASNQQLLTTTFLFREFIGEALRIFLPTLSEGAEKDIKSFLAALHLGLRLHYQGDVSHLQATVQTEPIPGNSNLRKLFIVLYDRIPGGTGYLKQFTLDPELLRTILQKSYDRMAVCACRHTGKDGCYRCLFAHRNSREMDMISRRTAMELLQTILDPKSNFKKIEEGVSKIDLVQVLESELERKFISALKEYSGLPGTEHRLKIEAKSLGTKNGYHLSVDNELWIVEPQVELDETMGNPVFTRIDFLLRHASNKDLLPIALSLDGWEHHHTRMETDTRQRLSLHRTGKYRIWTLTWEDVDDSLKPGPKPAGLLGVSNRTALQNLFARHGMQRWIDIGEIGSLRLLLNYLSHPKEELWKLAACGWVMANMEPGKTDSSEWVQSVSRWIPGSHPRWNPVWQGVKCGRRDAVAEWSGWAGREIKNNAVILWVNDSTIVRGTDKQCWQNFWRTVNVFQFIDDFVFVTEQAAADGSYNSIPMMASGPGFAGMDQAWQDIFELCRDDRISALLKDALAAHCTAPVLFHEIVEDEITVAQPEIAWPDQKIAVVAMVEDKNILASLGWQVLLVSELGNREILNWLKG